MAYLPISNVIQILLMPLITIGQNLQGRPSETRGSILTSIRKQRRKLLATLLHLERNTELLLNLMQHLDVRISDEKLRAIAAEKELARQLSVVKPNARP